MRNAFLKLYVKSQMLREALKDEHGQDLVEYALVCALIALGATGAMGTLASAINGAFLTVGTKLNTAM